MGEEAALAPTEIVFEVVDKTDAVTADLANEVLDEANNLNMMPFSARAVKRQDDNPDRFTGFLNY